MVTHEPPRLTIYLCFLFGVLDVASVLLLAFRTDNLTLQQFEILRIVLALGGGGLAAVLPGAFNLQWKTRTQFTLRASGAMAIFAAIYFYSPAHWQPVDSGVHQQAPGGVAAGTISNTSITITNSSATASISAAK